VSQTNNKSAYGVFSSIKADVERRIAEIESNIQPTIFIGMTTCGLAFCAMDVKGNTKEVISSNDWRKMKTDNSFKDCVIVSCGTLSSEINYLKKEGFFDAKKIFFTTPGLHEIPRELET